MHVESLALPVVLYNIKPLVLDISRTDILMLAAGEASTPDMLIMLNWVAAVVCATPDAITVVPSHNFAK